MNEGGPSAAELGLPAKDLESREENEVVNVELPSLEPRIVKSGSLRGKGVEREVPSIFTREEKIPPQQQFNSEVRNMVLVPVRAELNNGNLLRFLKQLEEQKGFDQEKLGIVFLINDNAKDQAEKPQIIVENKLLGQYLSDLSSKNIDGIQKLDIPQEYKDIAKQIIEKHKLELRFDYLHSSQEQPHFGELRLHLFKLAQVFKNKSIPNDQVIAHLSDIDTVMPRSHFETLKTYYNDPSHLVNFTEQDFVPGVHEGITDKDISKELLSYLDEFRLYRYSADIYNFLFHSELNTGTPIISGRLSLFTKDDQLEPIVEKLDRYSTGEDHFLGSVFRRITADEGSLFGNVGEVYRQHRARDTYESENGLIRGGTDAEEAFSAVSAFKKGEALIDGYNILNDGDNFLDYLEGQVSKSKSRGLTENSSFEHFKETDEYQKLLEAELKHEDAKVRLRRMRLVHEIESLAGNKNLTDTEKQIADPYVQYFDEEIEFIKQGLAEGKTSEQIAVSIISKYPLFFSHEAPIHSQIARLRALKKYVYAHDLIKTSGEYRNM